MKWCNRYYVDLTLPFGLHSAPFIFNAIADMVEWILVHPYQISALLHYLDDFIMAGPPDSPKCVHKYRPCSLQTAWPASPPGEMQNATVLVVLGIELDSVNQVPHLPAEKLLALQGLISSHISVAIDMNWSPSMAIYIMLPKWSGLAEPSYVALLIFFAASAKKII